jgi:hypothetical protein
VADDGFDEWEPGGVVVIVVSGRVDVEVRERMEVGSVLEEVVTVEEVDGWVELWGWLKLSDDAVGADPVVWIVSPTTKAELEVWDWVDDSVELRCREGIVDWDPLRPRLGTVSDPETDDGLTVKLVSVVVVATDERPKATLPSQLKSNIPHLDEAGLGLEAINDPDIDDRDTAKLVAMVVEITAKPRVPACVDKFNDVSSVGKFESLEGKLSSAEERPSSWLEYVVIVVIGILGVSRCVGEIESPEGRPFDEDDAFSAKPAAAEREVVGLAIRVATVSNDSRRDNGGLRLEGANAPDAEDGLNVKLKFV